MLNLTINTTRKVSTAEMRMACDPPLYFQVRAYFGVEISQQMVNWQQAGARDAVGAADILSQVFLSVSQNGDSYSLTTPANVLALREAVEANSPGEGDGFLCALLENFVSNHYAFFTKAENGSAPSSPHSDDGSSPAL